MLVKVKAGEINLDISVGDGRQTFKWLVQVIQQRIHQHNMRRKGFETESYIVTEIRNMSGELLNPADMIYEHGAAGGFSVSATVVSSYPVDEWDNPAVGDWMKSAYIKSEVGSHYADELEAWRLNLRRVEQQEESGHSGGTLGNARTGTFVQVGFDFSDAEIDSAFDLDWGSMKWSWMGEVSDSTKNAVGDIMQTNYRLVCSVFAHYCGIGQVGQRYGLSVEEFAHLLHFMRIYNYKETPEVIEEIFHKTSSNSGASSSSADFKTESKMESKVESKTDVRASGAGGGRYPLMTRAHLMQALLCAALSSKMGETPSAALTALILGPLTTFWHDISTNYLFYTTTDPMLKNATLEYYQLIKQAFLLRAASATPVQSGPKLSISKFVDLLVDTGMIDEEHEGICVNSFLRSQFNPSVHWELEDIVLAEFIEALSRVALKTIDSTNSGSELTDAKKIRMAFNFMTELQNEETSSSRK